MLWNLDRILAYFVFVAPTCKLCRVRSARTQWGPPAWGRASPQPPVRASPRAQRTRDQRLPGAPRSKGLLLHHLNVVLLRRKSKVLLIADPRILLLRHMSWHLQRIFPQPQPWQGPHSHPARAQGPPRICSPLRIWTVEVNYSIRH